MKRIVGGTVAWLCAVAAVHAATSTPTQTPTRACTVTLTIARAAEEWPQFMHDAAHGGAAIIEFPTPPHGVKWFSILPAPQASPGDPFIFRSSRYAGPVVAEGVVYVGQTGQNSLANVGTLLALSATSGELHWSYDLPFGLSTGQCGEQLAWADGMLYVAANNDNGTSAASPGIWAFNTSLPPDPTPVARLQATFVVPTASVTPAPTAWSHVAVSGGRVYTANCDTGSLASFPVSGDRRQLFWPGNDN